MKFEVRAKAGAINLMFLDDAGNVVLDVDGLPPADADQLWKMVRAASRAARAGFDKSRTISNERKD